MCCFLYMYHHYMFEGAYLKLARQHCVALVIQQFDDVAGRVALKQPLTISRRSLCIIVYHFSEQLRRPICGCTPAIAAHQRVTTTPWRPTRCSSVCSAVSSTPASTARPSTSTPAWSTALSPRAIYVSRAGATLAIHTLHLQAVTAWIASKVVSTTFN